MNLRTISSARVAWAAAGTLLVAAIVAVLYGLGVFGHGQRQSYTEIAALRAAEDRSQPLRMRLEARYPGPLQDTTIERWIDPVDGTICYIYMPIAVPHSQGPGGMVQYGSFNLGTISCFPAKQ
jgi:hypothetical protein